MFETLMEIMEPRINEIRKEERKEGRIQGTIETLRNLRRKDSEIKLIIMEQYGLTEEETEKNLQC